VVDGSEGSWGEGWGGPPSIGALRGDALGVHPAIPMNARMATQKSRRRDLLGINISRKLSAEGGRLASFVCSGLISLHSGRGTR
jgi:hypothetical protein